MWILALYKNYFYYCYYYKNPAPSAQAPPPPLHNQKDNSLVGNVYVVGRPAVTAMTVSFQYTKPLILKYSSSVLKWSSLKLTRQAHNSSY